MGVYGCHHLNLGCFGKAQVIDLGSEPDSGKPTVRDRRGAAGNVTFTERCARLLSTRP